MFHSKKIRYAVGMTKQAPHSAEKLSPHESNLSSKNAEHKFRKWYFNADLNPLMEKLWKWFGEIDLKWKSTIGNEAVAVESFQCIKIYTFWRTSLHWFYNIIYSLGARLDEERRVSSGLSKSKEKKERKKTWQFYPSDKKMNVSNQVYDNINIP